MDSPDLGKGRPDSTVICRCEEITLAEIMEAISRGARTLDAVKRQTRAGMGMCQGRTCHQAIVRLLAAAGRGPEQAGRPSIRPPVRPVLLEALDGGEGASTE